MSDEPNTHDLSRFTGRASLSAPITPPRHFNYWVIPTIAVTTLFFWACTVVRLVGSHSRPVELLDLVLVGLACSMTVTVILYPKILTLHRAMANDHGVIYHGQENGRSQMVELRAQTVMVRNEVRAANARGEQNTQNAYYEGMADQTTDLIEAMNGTTAGGGDVLRFSKHRHRQ